MEEAGDQMRALLQAPQDAVRPGLQLRLGPGRPSAQFGLHMRPGQLVWVEVRRIRRQDAQLQPVGMRGDKPLHRFARPVSSIRSRFVRIIVVPMNTIIVYKWVLQSTSLSKISLHALSLVLALPAINFLVLG